VLQTTESQKSYRHKCFVCGDDVSTEHHWEMPEMVICFDCKKKNDNAMKKEKTVNTCRYCKADIKTNSLDNRYFCNDGCEVADTKRVEANHIAAMAKIEEIHLELSIAKVIPKKYRDGNYTFDFNLDSVYDKSLFITGPAGVGKTTLMASLAKKYIGNDVDVKWLSFASFIIHLQRGFKLVDGDPYTAAAEAAEFKGMLMIDDLGAEKTTEYVRQTIYYILNEREQNCLPIIITSNLTLNELSIKADSRAASRIAGMCKQVKLTGKDRRIK